MASKRKILVIGGGFSGLCSIKCLKEEGYDPVCYEKTSNFGGTWYYREETPMGIPSIMPTTIINHSKEMGALSNYVPDKNYPNYLRHHELLKLMTEMAEKFDCLKHMVFNREVTQVKRSNDYEETGRWEVTVKNTETGEVTEEVFDVVWLAVGHITYPKMGHYPGMDKFRGTIMHSHSLKRVDKFQDKKVVVIGIGCSGLDAAVEISNVASQVYLSTRNGAWILPRIGSYGLPFDYTVLRRYVSIIRSLVGYKALSWYLETCQINKKFSHFLYNLRPHYPALAKDPSINDIIQLKLLSGSVVLRKDIKCFTEKGVIFENETHVTEIDAVIMATGYQWQFPFLEKGTLAVENNVIHLYKCIFPPQLKHATLAILGFILPFGPGFPLGEMQCRYAAQVISGKCKLPTKEKMIEDIQNRHERNLQRYAPSDKMSIRVDYIEYMDEIATEMRCKPNIWKILVTDPKLFWALIFGPSLPYQYRLEGPHKWEGAREAILTAPERVRFPLSRGQITSTKKSLITKSYFKYFAIILLMAFWLTQAETSLKFIFCALVFSLIMSCQGLYKKYLLSLIILPFLVKFQGFLPSYLITLFVPIFLTTVTFLIKV
ncbi:flavin-containing monooxygenase 5-like [Argiope bruennichi]|uniref:flavin-containing monooxygenase 5-like n=1 Tax=Argiope bruennichi TaxID=94029 RepID=UPI002495132C|nr:flavin-containing monooxygenase 5-like [Argiope bruennichi]